jgi:hypothetical protein
MDRRALGGRRQRRGWQVFGCRGILGYRNGSQRLRLADAELALFEVGLKMRGHVAHQNHVAGRHHEGQQQVPESGGLHHGPILKQILPEIAIHHDCPSGYNNAF